MVFLLALLRARAVTPLLIALFSFGIVSEAAEPEALLQQAMEAEGRFDCATALDLFLQLEKLRPADAFVLQKIARQSSDLVEDLDTIDARKRHAQLALTYSRRAVELEPASAVNALSVAISHGKLALDSDIRAKVEHSREVRKWAEKARTLDPRYSWSYHVLGRWHLGVAELGGASRLLVRMFYGGLPEASNAEAVTLLRRAVELAPEEPSHHIELGLAYLVIGDSQAARAALTQGLSLPLRGKHDQLSQRRARAALAKLK